MALPIFQFLIEFPDIGERAQKVAGPVQKPGLQTLGGILSAFLPVILTIAGILTFIWLIIGGFRLLFSGGDPKNVEGARNNITFAIIGLAIVFAAWWLALIVQNALDICIVNLGIVFHCP